MVLGVAGYGQFAAVGEHGVALRDRLDRVVRALGLHVRLQFEQQPRHVQLLKDGDEIHARERGDDLGPFRLRRHRVIRAFQRANGIVRVDGDNEHVTERLRAFEIAHVSHVQQVEAAVGEDDAPAFGFQRVNLLSKRGLIEDDLGHVVDPEKKE